MTGVYEVSYIKDGLEVKIEYYEAIDFLQNQQLRMNIYDWLIHGNLEDKITIRVEAPE